MDIKSIQRPYRAHGTFIVAYNLHPMTEAKEKVLRDKNPENPPDREIDIALSDMSGLYVFKNIWIVRHPGVSCKGLKKKLKECLDTGDRLMVAPLDRPYKVKGTGITDTLETLDEMLAFPT